MTRAAEASRVRDELPVADGRGRRTRDELPVAIDVCAARPCYSCGDSGTLHCLYAGHAWWCWAPSGRRG